MKLKTKGQWKWLVVLLLLMACMLFQTGVACKFEPSLPFWWHKIWSYIWRWYVVVLNNMYNNGNGKKEKIGAPIICCCSLFPRGRESSALILTRHCRLINEEKQCWPNIVQLASNCASYAWWRWTTSNSWSWSWSCTISRILWTTTLCC